MKKTTLALLMTVFTASTLFSTVTRADGPTVQQWHQQGGHDGHGDNDGHGGPGRGHDDRGSDGRGDHHRDDNHGRDHGPRRHFEERDRFAWHGHDFRRGRPLPPDFRGDNYRVYDWHQRGLREPPRGQHWAYIDGNYVLIAAATGVITAILLNGAYQ
ncbi:RcnB family protein [Erwinia psidii]|uniref:Nickel/cobalt homeostasis protein RcnB n=1 Tax=Erwinia psidii TaxID=69224 RepID=A0A3N6RYL4_9GAMM|nr:RcnB family protein [Erwinia psidii]MCX8957084.1 hypothetical protein [Erwinia psidii]MCX8961736.1 hypothetical protein [Erwinia psidii]MCX8965330.1 hypothetical protein [Erwinia psidii]RQM37537.1 hypothetical protein EB241_14965 [Erwinia psidii]